MWTPLLTRRRARRAGIRQLPEPVRERARGVDERPWQHAEALVGEPILDQRFLKLAVAGFAEFDYAGVVERGASALGKGFDQREVIPGIVELAVAVDNCPRQSRGVQQGQSGQGFGGRQIAAGGQRMVAGNPVVKLQPHAEIADVAAAEAGHQQFQRMSEKGAFCQHQAAFAQGAPDHVVLPEIAPATACCR